MLFRSKKSMVLNIAISVALSVVVLTVIVPLISKPIAFALTKGGECSDSKFAELAMAINEVNNASVYVPPQKGPAPTEEGVGTFEQPEQAQRTAPRRTVIVENFNLDDDKVIAGFSENIIYESSCAMTGALGNWLLGHDRVYMPVDWEECRETPCICMCDEDDLCETPLDCKKINKVPDSNLRQIVVPSDIEENLGKPAGGEYEYLLLFGDCDGFSAGNVGVIDLAVEKIEDKIVISDKACHNYQKGRSECYNRDTCPAGSTEVTTHKCNEGQICCV